MLALTFFFAVVRTLVGVTDFCRTRVVVPFVKAVAVESTYHGAAVSFRINVKLFTLSSFGIRSLESSESNG